VLAAWHGARMVKGSVLPAPHARHGSDLVSADGRAHKATRSLPLAVLTCTCKAEVWPCHSTGGVLS